MFSRLIHGVDVLVVSSFSWLNIIPLHGYAALCLSIHPLMVFGLFDFLAVMSNAAMNVCVQVLVWIYIFYSMAIYLGVGLQGHIKAVFNSLRSCHVFQSSCTILYSCQQHLSISMTPNPCQHLLLFIRYVYFICKFRSILHAVSHCGLSSSADCKNSYKVSLRMPSKSFSSLL